MERTRTIALYQYNYCELRTYLATLLFVAGNIILPQLCHLIPQGGLILLPIYFFTLIGAYKYGFTVGLLTAVFSPLVNNLLFGMPPTPMLPVILLKSTMLALAAAFIASRSGKVTLLNIALAVIAYQLLGGIGEAFISGSVQAPLQDVTLGLPGILLQIIGGWALLKYVIR